MIGVQVSRRPARDEEIDQALKQLDRRGCIYFGCDAGVAGLHPRQATLLDEPDLALRVYEDGVAAQACSDLGASLLRHNALRDWTAQARCPAGRPPMASLRAFLGAFEPLPEVFLMGALGFDAWRLAGPRSGSGTCLGQLYFADRYWQRTPQGRWERIELLLHALGADTAAAAPTQTPTPTPRARAFAAQDDHPPGGYADMVARGLTHLRDPSLVSLTLSQSFRRSTEASPCAAFARLRKANPAPATFFFNDGNGECLFGASPDLQLVVRQGQVESLPVCGTVARGPGPVGEAESLRELLNETVDAASLAVCTDALRNDLAPLCEPGSLRLMDRRRPLSLATVVHTVDRIGGRLREGVDAWNAIVATTAPVMVTGTPRHAALAAIHALEVSPRGWYGGLVIQVCGNGDALAGTILRAAVIRDGLAEVRTGGDLMADSTPAREEQESRLKALSLWRALRIDDVEVTAAAVAQPSRRTDNVALLDAGDPFPAAVRECLEGMGLRLDENAELGILIGTDTQRCNQLMARYSERPLVAIGDAACHVLQRAGFEIESIRPMHGRLMRCVPTAACPDPERSTFLAAQYASLALAGSGVMPGWEAWAQDMEGRATILVHPQRRRACLLFRPDSLLSGSKAHDLLGFAISALSGLPR
jgi:anthranilate/para-aminobenzoate synthase component I